MSPSPSDRRRAEPKLPSTVRTRSLQTALGIFDDFFDGSDTVVDRTKAVFAERRHAQLDRFLPYHHGRSAIADEITQRIGNFQKFVNSLASSVPRLIAHFTASSIIKILIADVMRRETEGAEDGFRGFVRGTAIATDLANEALGEDAFEGGGDEKWLHAHVDQPGHGAGGIVRVEGREDEVTGEGCLDRNLGRLGVTCFADENAIRVLSEKRTEESPEAEPDSLVDRHLNDAVDLGTRLGPRRSAISTRWY